MITELDENPVPQGDLMLQTVAMPKDTNATGDIFGGWLLSQMDIAGGVAASQIAQGRVATVAIDRMNFMVPVKVGSVVACYTDILSIGRSSIQVQIEVWMTNSWESDPVKVTEGVFVFVAIDENGRTRIVPQ
jgi:acyl-CoA thioesterase YciA